MSVATGVGSPPARRTAVLAVILVSYLLIVLDISIVVTGLPRIRDDLGFSPSGLSWVQNAYMLTFGGLLLLGARAGDILGRRRMFVVGVALFTAASLAVGLAQSPWELLAARAAQGVGAAVLAPSTLALLAKNFPGGAERTRAFSLYGSVGGIGSTFGLVVGGVLADWASWRVGFFINLPVGVALILAARRFLSETERHLGRLDVAGAATATVGMTALVFGFVHSASAGWGDDLTVGSIAVGALLMVAFVVCERRAEQPIMPLRLFASRERAGAYAVRMLFLGAAVDFYFFTTQFLQGVLGYGPAAAGIAFLATTIPNFAAALALPRLTRRLGNGRVLAFAIAISLVGTALLTRVSADMFYLADVLLPMVVVGLGQGASLAPLTVAGVSGVAPEDAGAASGVVNVAHQLGGSLGLSILIAVSAAAVGAGPGHTLLAQRVDASFAAATVMIVLALVVVLATVARSRKAEPAPAPEAGLASAVEAVPAEAGP